MKKSIIFIISIVILVCIMFIYNNGGRTLDINKINSLYLNEGTSSKGYSYKYENNSLTYQKHDGSNITKKTINKDIDDDLINILKDYRWVSKDKNVQKCKEYSGCYLEYVSLSYNDKDNIVYVEGKSRKKLINKLKKYYDQIFNENMDKIGK